MVRIRDGKMQINQRENKTGVHVTEVMLVQCYVY